MKIISAVVLDLTGNAMEWLDDHGNEDHLEICELITLDDNSPVKIWELYDYDNWDVLLVFEKGVRERTQNLLDKIGINSASVIYPLDVEGSLYDNREISAYIFDDNIRRTLEYVSHRKSGEKYTMVTADGLAYVNASTDNTILPVMLNSRKNWAAKEMSLFYSLSYEYFSFSDEQEIFCDIGANVGTTCIYFKKKLDENITILAFEPSTENFKLLKINALLNDIDISMHLFINAGVSDRSEDAVISFNPINPGGSSIVNDNSDIKEKVTLISFDDFLTDNNVDISRLKYLWIDVEGYEARFLAGARRTLKQTNIPIFMEFIPRFYAAKSGEFELLINELEASFRYFICVQHSDAGKQAISVLRDYQNDDSIEWDIFLLKD